MLTMDQAAETLGVSRRTLTELIKGRPDCCLWGGRKKLFDEEHITALREAIREKTKCRIARTAVPELTVGGSTSRSRVVSGYEEVLSQLTEKKRKRSLKGSKPKNGNGSSKVIDLQSHLRRP